MAIIHKFSISQILVLFDIIKQRKIQYIHHYIPLHNWMKTDPQQFH